ncbi:Ig-like domain repeat protein [Tundrisphaera sp. TA3]|uniref:Ig-like domain repeat protein n=1 Tax=Tundrisphaera sp. TA3 TaxID=3435775 RepID=UPI003EBD454E
MPTRKPIDPRRPASARRPLRARHLAAEGLEPRALLAITPVAVANVVNQATNTSPGFFSSTTDAAGNHYLAGSYDQTLGLAPLSKSLTKGSKYVAKLDGDGQAIWAVNIGGGTAEAPEANVALSISDVQADAQGNVYVVGGTSSTFPTRIDAPIYATPNNDSSVVLNNTGSEGLGFAIKFDSQGRFVYRLLFDSDPGFNANINSVEVDASGNAYFIGTYSCQGDGSFSGVAVYSSTPRTSNNYLGRFNLSPLQEGGLVARVGPNGGIGSEGGWVKSYNTPAFGTTRTAIDEAGDLYLMSTTFDAVTFGSVNTGFTTLRPDTNTSLAYVLKLKNSSGEVEYAKRLVQGSPSVSGLTVDAAGRVYATGNYSNKLTYTLGSSSPKSFTSQGNSQDIFVARLDASGNTDWVKSLGGSGTDSADAIATDGQGLVLLAGSYKGASPFGSLAQGSTIDSQDIYLAQIAASDGRAVSVVTGGGTGSDGVNGLRVSPSGGVTLIGSFAASTPSSSLAGLTLPGTGGAVIGQLQLTRPTAQLTPLAAEVHDLSFPVLWGNLSSADARTFDIFVSDNGGASKPWLTGTPLKTANYTGVEGHRYAFTAVAIDESGLRSNLSAPAFTTVRTMAATAVAVRPSLPQFLAGQPATFVATVTTPDGAWAGQPTGSVQFLVDGQPLGSPVAIADGVATSPAIATLAAGLHSVAARFAGTGRFLASEAGPAEASVVRSLVTASVVPLPAEVRDNPFEVRWTGQSDSGIAGYDVFVSVDGGPLAPWFVATPGTAATYPGVEGHTYGFAVVAINGLGERSATPPGPQSSTLVRTRAATATAVLLGSGRIASGVPSGIAAMVTTPDGAWAGVPTGTVQFTVDGQPLGGPVAVDGSGLAALPAGVPIPPGFHFFGASFSGTGRFLPSLATDQAQSISLERPTAFVDPLPAVSNSPAILVSWGGESPAGIAGYDVFVSVDGGPLTPWLSGTAERQAVYPGEAGRSYGFAAVAIGGDGQASIEPTAPMAATRIQIEAATSIMVEVASPRVVAGQPFVFTARVTAAVAGAGTPGGLVQFYLDGAPLGGPVPLDGGGVAASPVTTLAAGPHTIAAGFVGGGAFLSSGSAPIGVTAESPIPVPTVRAVRATAARKKGKLLGIQVGFDGALDPASAGSTANYVLTMMSGKKGKTRSVAVRLKGVTYAPGSTTVTLTLGKKPKAGRYQLQVASTAAGGLRGVAGAPLVGGTATLSLKL